MSIIDRINEEVSIYDLFDIADTPVKYLTRGKPCQISCPFHGEDKHPSARVFPDSNSFRCFFCSKSWNPVSYWAEANQWFKEDGKLDIARSIDDLCDRYNLSSQTFDWQKKFYRLKAQEKEKGVVPHPDRLKLVDYYSWEIIKILHKIEDRETLQDTIVDLWKELDAIDTTAEQWQDDLKNWYECAKLRADGHRV